MKPIKKVCYEGRTNKRNKEGLKKREETNMEGRKDIKNRIKERQKKECVNRVNERTKDGGTNECKKEIEKDFKKKSLSQVVPPSFFIHNSGICPHLLLPGVAGFTKPLRLKLTCEQSSLILVKITALTDCPDVDLR